MADNIDWSVPCVICIAHDFTKYVIHAVNQMQRNIKLVSYRKYDNELILFEHLNTPKVKPISESAISDNETKSNTQKSHVEKLKLASNEMKNLYHSICDFIESLGDDIVQIQLKNYLAYKKVQNMVCIEIFTKQIILFLKLNPETVVLEEGFTSDVRNKGHHGTGDLQVTVKCVADFEKVKPLLERAYNEA